MTNHAEGGGERRAIGPVLPPHLAAAVDGVGSHSQSTSSDGARPVKGPTMPPSSAEQEVRLSAGAQAFLDREKRMKEAAEREEAGLTPVTQETSRAEWMLAPPTSKSFAESLQQDQSAALKNRGFSQTQNARVQRGRGGAGLSGAGEEDMSLWTETPQEREKRLKEEELGIRPKAADLVQVEDEEEREKRQADRERERRIQEAVREHEAKRGPSLLEQHQAKRRDEIRSKNNKRHSKEEDSERRRHRRYDSDYESSADESRRKHSDDRERRRKRSDRYDSQSDSDSDSYSSADDDSRRRHHKSSRKRTDERERKRDNDESRHKSSRHRHRHSHRSDSRDDRERDRRRKEKEREKEKEKEREKRQKRKDREREEKEEKKGAPMMVWDREAAMSVGGKLLDDQKRMETIRSAAGLGSRFGSGSSQIL